jgi:histidine triad (HIT) family protein
MLFARPLTLPSPAGGEATTTTTITKTATATIIENKISLMFFEKSDIIQTHFRFEEVFMYQGCLFCMIIKGDIVSKKVYEDDWVLAFDDISPQAPVHIIIVPKKHISSLKEISQDDEAILGHIQFTASKIAAKYPQLDNGYRLVNNCGKDALQSVLHLHYHLLGGRVFEWPAG